MARGEMHYNRVSRFVKEIPEHLLKGTMPKETIKEMPSQQAYASAKQAFNSRPYGMGAERKPYQTKQNYGGAYSTGKEFCTAATEAKTLEYVVGDRVRHMKFGEGTVQTIQAGGRDFEVTVDFEKAGVKKMFASFAKLKKV